MIFQKGPSGLIQKVLEAGPDLNAILATGYPYLTPLQAAALHWDLDLVKQLIGQGADINQPAFGDMGSTALQAACRANALTSDEERDRMRFVAWLIANGADVNAEAAKVDGSTALQSAAALGNLDLAALLLDHGADPNGPASTLGKLALDQAVSRGRLDMVQLLLNVGAVGRVQRQTPFDGAIDRAMQEGNLVIADLLRNHARDNAEIYTDQEGVRDRVMSMSHSSGDMLDSAIVDMQTA